MLLSSIRNTDPDYFGSPLFITLLLGERLNEYRPNRVTHLHNVTPFKNFFEGYRKVFFPINYKDSHWTLMEIDFERQTISYFDSCGSGYASEEFPTNKHPIEKIFDWLQTIARNSKRGREFLSLQSREWKLYFDGNDNEVRPRDKNIKYGYQQNGYDCAIFTIVTAEILSGLPSKKTKKLDFSKIFNIRKMESCEMRLWIANLILMFRFVD